MTIMLRLTDDRDTVKMLHETLCYAQTYLPRTEEAVRHRDSLGRILVTLEVYRPLGPDGKHDNRHTRRCGCDDIPYTVTQNNHRVVDSEHSATGNPFCLDCSAEDDNAPCGYYDDLGWSHNGVSVDE